MLPPCCLIVEVGEVMDIGSTPYGERRVIPITGGSFKGPILNGIVLPGGADWQIIRPDNVTELEARYTLCTNEAAKISVINRGLRHGPKDVMKKLMAGECVD